MANYQFVKDKYSFVGDQIKFLVTQHYVLFVNYKINFLLSLRLDSKTLF